jgi:cytochrome c
MRDCLVVPWLGLALGCVAVGSAVLADNADKVMSYGRHLAQECTGCHRTDGVDNGIPSIVGWDADQFARTIAFYRTGERTNPVMVSVVSSLDPEQVRALAAYYASLPKPAKR